MSDKFSLFSRFFRHFFLILAIMCAMQFLLTGVSLWKWTEVRYTVIAGAVFSLFAAFHFSFKQSLKTVVLPTVLAAVTMPLLFIYGKGTQVLSVMVWDEAVFFLYLMSCAAVLQFICGKLFGYTTMVNGVFAAFRAAVFIYPLLFIAYYAVSGDVLDTNSLIAVYQTNYRESYEFISTVMTRRACVVILAAFLAALYLCRWCSQLNCTGSRVYAAPIVIFILFAVVLNGKYGSSYLQNIAANSSQYLSSVQAFNDYRLNADGSMKKLPARIADFAGKGNFVLIIGESQNRDHMQCYGYTRQTTPWLDSVKKDADFIFFTNAYACHTLTMKALSQVLTEANQYNGRDFAEAYSIIDLANAAGYNTVWISNQAQYGAFNTPITVISDLCREKIWLNSEGSFTNRYDEDILAALPKVKLQERNFIVLHLSGNHYEYKDRYPEKFVRFTTEEGILKTPAALDKLNEYDNSIFYNDYILQELFSYCINQMQAAGVIYFSDHGEDVYADKKHIPGNFTFAMARIPLIMYFSPQYQSAHADSFAALKGNSGAYFTNDLLYDTMIDVLGIETPLYTPANSLADRSYQYTRENLATLAGTVPLRQESN